MLQLPYRLSLEFVFLRSALSVQFMILGAWYQLVIEMLVSYLFRIHRAELAVNISDHREDTRVHDYHLGNLIRTRFP